MCERNLLKNFLDECLVCQRYFADNVELLADGPGALTDEQSGEILILLSDFHLMHESVEEVSE